MGVGVTEAKIRRKENPAWVQGPGEAGGSSALLSLPRPDRTEQHKLAQQQTTVPLRH